MQIINLSVAINEQTPVYPGDPPVKITAAGVLERDGWCDHLVAFGTHVGTHIDAPAHMIEGGKTLDQIPIEHFIGTGKYVKIDGIFDLESIKRAGINAGDIVLFDTGMAEKYHDPTYFTNYPAMSEEVANYLVDCKVKIIGLDTGSADVKDDFPIHKILLINNVLIIENLTNLQALKNKNFKVYALPLNLSLDGAPARVIAETN